MARWQAACQHVLSVITFLLLFFAMNRMSWLTIVFITLAISLAQGQNSYISSHSQIRLQVANLIQDLDLLRDQMVRLSQEVVLLRQVNTDLKRRLAEQEQREFPIPKQDNLSRAQLNDALQRLQRSWQQQIAKQEKQVSTKFSQQIVALTQRFNRSLKALAETLDAEPKIIQEKQFSEDYPQKGLPYIVKPGDTLSEIAQQFNASARDIQNANRIIEPSRDLRVGQTIFIPQQESLD